MTAPSASGPDPGAFAPAANAALVLAEDLELLVQAGRYPEAVEAARRFARLFPRYRLGWERLASSLRALDRPAEALTVADRYAALMPGLAAPYWERGAALRDLGRMAEAVHAWRRIVHLETEDWESLQAVGDAFFLAEAWEDAVAAHAAVLRLCPLDLHSRIHHLRALEFVGNSDAILIAARRALVVDPTVDGFYVVLSRALRSNGFFDASRFMCGRAIHVNPESLVARLDLSIGQQDDGLIAAAIDTLKEALTLDPACSEALLNLSNVYFDAGLLDETFALCDRVIRLGQDSLLAMANKVVYLHYAPAMTAADIRDVIDTFATRFAPAVGARPLIGDPDPDRPLTVGLISNGFSRHPALVLSILAFENLDRSAFRLIAYSGRTLNDPMNDRLRACATVKPVQHLEDPQLVDLIRSDGVDILIDMAGHGSGVRLGVYPHRPAPVQVKWVGGLINTTGVDGMDWLIADAVEVPPGDEGLYTERIHRMPDGYLVFDPPEYAPPVWPLPARIREQVTFGSFNNPVKVNETMIGLWARILSRVPGSRLLLKGKRFSVPEVQARFTAAFAAHGIEADRLVMRGHSDHRDQLRTFNEVDIAFDPWPYSGGLTTCESLWMGVPVITMPGPTFAGRHAASHLTNVGLTDWIVDSPAAYEDLAVSWAGRLDDLEALRRSLRDRVAAAPLVDGPRFTRHFEQALRAMWRDAIARSGATGGRPREGFS